MRGNHLLEKMELVDEKYVEEAGRERAAVVKPRAGWKLALIAAVLVLAIAAVPIGILIANRASGGGPAPMPFTDAQSESKETGTDVLPTQSGDPTKPSDQATPSDPTQPSDHTQPTATTTETPQPTTTGGCEQEELFAGYVGSLFSDTYEDNGTKIYVKVALPSLDALKYTTIDVPDGGRAFVYRMNNVGKPLDGSEFTDFINGLKDKLSTALSQRIDLPDYRADDERLRASTGYSGNYVVDFYQYPLYATANFGVLGEDAGALTVDGLTVVIDQRLSDEEIIASLSDVKAKLCALYGRNFEDAKVVRSYSTHADVPLTTLKVIFFNESDHPLTAMVADRITDRIELTFKNYDHGNSSRVSDGELDYVDVRFVYFRVPVDEFIIGIDRTGEELLSLDEAKELLKKGYVFGAHACPQCMAEQPEVDFGEYDAVRLTYVDGFPFYAFYKKIGDLPNGCEQYARTLVTAVRVSGLEEYFEAQTAFHTVFPTSETHGE